MSRGPIPPEVISQVRERVDIADVVSAYVTLSRAGQNLKGICPFHSEKTPSFMVSQSRQRFHCFGCGVGGDVFAFLMNLERITFPDAVRELGRRSGVPVQSVVAEPSADWRLRERLEQIHGAAARWFGRNLSDPQIGGDAMAYLAARGIARQTVEAFGLGVALPMWDGLIRALAEDGYSPADLAAAGLAVAKDQGGRRSRDTGGYYDRFRRRLMIPISDLGKRVIAFGGRILGEGEPKYLNSPETPLFNKGRTLYGLERARDVAGRSNHLIVVEGYFDTIALHQAGITNVVATLGTALTPDHLRTIRRFVSKVVLLFDPDPAGVRAALRTLDLFVGSTIGVTVVSLPDGQDPDAFVRKQGAAAFLTLQEKAPSLLDFAVEHSLRSAASGSIDDRIRSVDEILRILQKADHPIEKEECLRRVSERLGISQQRLVERYPELVSRPDRPVARQSAPVPDGRQRRNPEEWELAHLLLSGHLTPTHVQRLQAEAFTVPACRRIVELALGHRDGDGRVLLRPLLDEAADDPSCSSIVTELSLSDRYYEDIPAHINGCLATLERKQREQNLGELIMRLRTAEREGRTDEVRALNAQVNEVRIRKAALPSLDATSLTSSRKE